MLYIPKIGDIVKVNRMVGDDPKLLQNNQEVENIIKVDTTDVETYQVDLVGSGYLFTNHDLILISRSNNLLSVSSDSNTETVLSEPENEQPSKNADMDVDCLKDSHVSENQKKSISEMKRIMNIFKNSNSLIRPHFILTGPSGSGKSNSVQVLCEDLEMPFIEINAAQLTKEGTAGNSLSKALSGLLNSDGKPTICFVDEFDKLFISGNSNSQLAHETTNGVQNEFLKVLESEKATVAGDYGKYIEVPIKNVLFIFAGAFNGEENITIDRLREFGIKTEFLGRVGLVYNLRRLSLEDMYSILEKSVLLSNYCKLFKGANREQAVNTIKNYIAKTFDSNTLGARLVNTLVHQYFIKGGKLDQEEVDRITFQNPIEF